MITAVRSLMPLVLVLAALLAGVCGGCSRSFTAMHNPVDIDPVEYPRMYDAAVLVLREQGFRVDRQDYRFGKITTAPRSSPTLAEVWHADNTTAYQAAESTINHQRRVVTVSFEPAELPAAGARAPAALPEPQGYLIRVEVMREQLQIPHRRLSGATKGHRVFSDRQQVPGELRERGVTGAYWQTIGRDPYLEQRLLAEIVRRSVRVPGPTREPARPTIDITEPPPTQGL